MSQSNTAEVLSIPSSPKKNSKSNDDSGSLFDSKQSEEIIVGVCGAIGCCLSQVIDHLKTEFKSIGYEVEEIKLSDIIKETFISNPSLMPQGLSNDDLEKLDGAERYRVFQKLGNILRQEKEANIVAQLASQRISAKRTSKQYSQNKIESNDTSELSPEELAKKLAGTPPPRVAYIVNQLKNPAEVDLFRKLYGKLFYLIGVLSPEPVRLDYLVNDELLDKVDAIDLIEIDRKESQKTGQRLEDTLKESDFFISNALDNINNLERPTQRFVGLVHGKNGLTPTNDEAGMYAAFSASLKSACLSRQVGASIMDSEGNIIATGWNDVPRAYGGLYSADDYENDQRCVHHGRKCYNDEYKGRLEKKISKLLNDILTNEGFDKEEQVKLREHLKADAEGTVLNSLISNWVDSSAAIIAGKTPISSLIEYSRAIHAEMEAILSLARKTNASVIDSTMYTTTYPCHNCARHILAAGIKKVVFIEPYEKSLATKLHSDAITHGNHTETKISFTPFEGVAPRRYQTFFNAIKPRKTNGHAVDIIQTDRTEKKENEFIEDYKALELRLRSQLKEKYQLEI